VCGRLPAHAYLRDGGSGTVIPLLLVGSGRCGPGSALYREHGPGSQVWTPPFTAGSACDLL